MERNYKKGFTLIELLVVIAIIGILSAVVLASLNAARTRAADASVQSNLKTIQTQSIMYYDTNGQRYGASGVSSCPSAAGGTNMFGDTTIFQALQTARSSARTNTATCFIDATGQQWSVSVPLRSHATHHWCVDWRGTAHRTAAAATTPNCGGAVTP